MSMLGSMMESFLMEEESRQSLRRRRVYRYPKDEAFALPDDVFIKYFRLSKGVVFELCEELRPCLETCAVQYTKLSAEKKILCALRFFATGSYQQSVANEFTLQVSQPSASRAIHQVCSAVNEKLLRKWIKFPTERRSLHKIKREFYEIAGFPGIVGAIDCTHVLVCATNEETHPEQIFVNRHGTHSLNVQMVCDANLMILSCNARYPGSSHDSFIWRNCSLKRIMRRVSYEISNTWLLGDSGYPLEPWLLTSLLQPQTPNEAIYNRKHIATRNVIEICFGVLKSRFRCLLGERKLHYHPQVAAKIVNTCVVLHNMCRFYNVADVEISELAASNQPVMHASQEEVAGAREIQRQLINSF